jgi:hypothetical protein
MLEEGLLGVRILETQSKIGALLHLEEPIFVI